MGDFKEIKTQEEFDEAIKERLAREREKFADYENLKKYKQDTELEFKNFKDKSASDLANKDAELSKKLAEIDSLNSKIKAYESDSVKTRIALQKGLPYEFASRLQGETEEEIMKDAETISSFMHKGNPEPTYSVGESGAQSSQEEAWMGLLSQLND